jgi:hypothetical protein
MLCITLNVVMKKFIRAMKFFIARAKGVTTTHYAKNVSKRREDSAKKGKYP